MTRETPGNWLTGHGRPATSGAEDHDRRADREPEHQRSPEPGGALDFPGGLAAAVAGWFSRFPAETTVLQDAYLLDPHLPGLSVKVREGRALEVKVYRGSPGLLEVAGCARGRLESWQKWSFPHGPASVGGADLAGWRPVSKRRRISRFSMTGGPARVNGGG